ncbi:hypothetical protein SCP_0800270 [Sparassis crispa]|uniref:Uncharacterized protein n=1 Tax=Sparassis crispa TaxID=139825 RepID=A0A401GTJ4_9APHY|nr:hypothetical protein SCP_0800270 [Sparassis crispa]GBE85510.1 hypothetical protein SCP_0800270 [Sparassis crispa]
MGDFFICQARSTRLEGGAGFVTLAEVGVTGLPSKPGEARGQSDEPSLEDQDIADLRLSSMCD